MLAILRKNIKLGFGKKEATKTGKSVAVGGVGAVAFDIISNLGYMPEAATAPSLMPYAIAGLTVAINSIRQFFSNLGE